MANRSGPSSGKERDPISALIGGNEVMTILRDHIDRYDREGGQPPQIAFLDIDRFNGLASMLGEEGAREMLRVYSARLSDGVGEAGVVARGSGDRFFVLFEDPIVRERLSGLFEAPLVVTGRNVYTPTSAGVAVYPRDAEEPHQLIRCAGMAMKWAKRIAPGTLIEFNAKMRDDAARSRLVEDCMRAAIENPDREFHLVYQPKTIFKTGEIAGVEALMRWNSPILGPVSPDEFVKVAEATRLILPLGRWLLDTAFKALRKWRDKGYVVEMAVNVSPVELKSEVFAEYLLDRLATYGLEPEMIEIEVTEGQLVENSVIEMLLRLRKLGFNIAIDDFGRDQSNLSRVASLPATTLKIDKSLTDGLLDDHRQFVLMKNILSLAADLGLRSVVEGIETLEQANQLSQIGGVYGQGYYMSRPIPADEITKLIDRLDASQN
jgi:diguanylate cyclase (GGDEF)-like protein